MADILKFKGVAVNATLYTVPTGKRAKVVLTPSITGLGTISTTNDGYVATDFYVGKLSSFIVGNFSIKPNTFRAYSCVFYNQYGELGIEIYNSQYSHRLEGNNVVDVYGSFVSNSSVLNFPKEHLLAEGETVTSNASGSYGFCGYNFMVIEEDV